MEVADSVKKWQEFFESFCIQQLSESKQLGKDLFIDFKKVMEFDPELAELLCSDPEEQIKCIELSAELVKQKVHIFNLTESYGLNIADVRSKHLNILISTVGVIRQRSPVRPNITSMKFECPGCGQVINVLQFDEKVKEPEKCGCGRKGKFKLLSKELEDIQGLVLEETIESAEGDKTERIKVLLKGSLTNPDTRSVTRPGNKVQVVGVVKEIAIYANTGAKLTKLDLVLDASSVVSMEESFDKVNISSSDELEIKRVGKGLRDPLELLSEALLPNIYGYKNQKLGLALQCFGGNRIEHSKDANARGNIHILLVGDPGVAKSHMLERISKFVSKGRFVSAASASGVGLTGVVVKDEFLKGYTLEAGAMVLANKGLCCIDELDKTEDKERNQLHEAMEQERVTIAKANIQEQLPTQTTVLAAANPDTGRFDSEKPINSQIKIASTLLNRFDLIFVLKDLPNIQRDGELADFILSQHSLVKEKVSVCENPFSNLEFARKYLAYAKKNFTPVLTNEAREVIKKFYVDLRNSNQNGSIAIGARQLRAVARLSEAVAKAHLSSKVTVDFVQTAIGVLKESLYNVALDPVTGKLDIDRIESDYSHSERKTLAIIRDVIHELGSGGDLCLLEDIIKACKERGIKEYVVEDVLQKLSRSGELFEPKPGYIKSL